MSDNIIYYDFNTLYNFMIKTAQTYNINIEKINNNIPQFMFLCRCVGDKFRSINYFKLPNDENKNVYNIDFICSYVNIFLSICNSFNILSNMYLFCIFIGISDSIIYKCISDGRLNADNLELIKSIQGSTDNAIDLKLANSNQIVGQITLHNDKFNRIPEHTQNVVENLPIFDNKLLTD